VLLNRRPGRTAYHERQRAAEICASRWDHLATFATMASCCCCIGLRTGTILVGIIFLLFDIAALVWSALGLAEKVEPYPREFLRAYSSEQIRLSLWVFLVVSAVSVLCDFGLVIAAGGRRRCGQVLWLVWTGIRLVLATLGFLVMLGIAIWLLVDESAADKLSQERDVSDIWGSISDTIQDLGLTQDEIRERKRAMHLAMLIVAIAGLVIISILWGWFSAVDRNQKRLRHTTVVVKTQHVHTSRL